MASSCPALPGVCQVPITKRPHLELIGLRINEGLSREQLALRANTSRETIRLAETGVVPGPRIQKAIAGVFGKRPLDLWPIETQMVGR
jgi:DNA-binding XRE family transcriptional regulator